MSYLIDYRFNSKYPQGQLLGEGSYGKVYLSGSSVVKEISGDTAFTAFQSAIKELDIYSQINHPCIVRILNWTYSAGVFKIALPLGKSVYEMRRSLKFWDVASDLLSAMDALYDLGVAHNDIKVENLIYHEGRVKLIDFGLLTPLTDYQNTSAMAVYLVTLGYRDPGAHFEYSSDYRFELYSVASVLAVLFGGILSLRENIPLPSLKFGDKRQAEFYQDLLQYPVETRLTTRQLFQKYPKLTRRVGVILKTPISSTKIDCGQSVIERVNTWILGLATSSKMKIQTLFLSLHLFRRVLEEILPNYDVDRDQAIKAQSLAVTCLSLASIMTDDPSTFEFSVGANLSSNTTEEIEVMAMNVLIKTKCTLITETPWNYARNDEELVWGFLNLFRCDYEVNVMADLSGNSSRLINIEDFYNLVKGKLQGNSRYSALISQMPPGQPRLPFPVFVNYQENLLTFQQVNLAVDLYNNKQNPQYADHYDLGAVLRHNYGNDSSSEVNLVLQKLRKTSTGTRYAQIIQDQMIPFQYIAPDFDL